MCFPNPVIRRSINNKPLSVFTNGSPRILMIFARQLEESNSDTLSYTSPIPSSDEGGSVPTYPRIFLGSKIRPDSYDCISSIIHIMTKYEYLVSGFITHIPRQVNIQRIILSIDIK